MFGNAFVGIFTNFALFRSNGILLQCVFFCSLFVGNNILLRGKIEHRFNSLINPYYEKY
jgi:hypothetical protein